MKRKTSLWAIGLLLLFAGPALAEAFTQINPETPVWQMGLCFAIVCAGGAILNRATSI